MNKNLDNLKETDKTWNWPTMYHEKLQNMSSLVLRRDWLIIAQKTSNQMTSLLILQIFKEYQSFLLPKIEMIGTPSKSFLCRYYPVTKVKELTEKNYRPISTPQQNIGKPNSTAH